MVIHYISPYSTDGNIGRALNEACALVPDGDWICLRDGDMMYLTPDWGKQIEEVIRRHGDQYDLFGCMTNRLGGQTQLISGMYNETDIVKHYEKAVELAKDHWAEVVPIRARVAGMFMLFNKSTWKKHRFAEGKYQGVKFDIQFGKDILRAKGNVGLIKGLYVFHLYRIWSEASNPIGDIRHLL